MQSTRSVLDWRTSCNPRNTKAFGPENLKVPFTKNGDLLRLPKTRAMVVEEYLNRLFDNAVPVSVNVLNGRVRVRKGRRIRVEKEGYPHSKKISYGVSATTVKSWFQYRCDRKTRYEIMNDDERSAIPITKEVTPNAWTAFGNQFEKTVIERLSAENTVLRPNPGDFSLSEAQGIAFLKGELKETFAHQINLRTPKQISDLVFSSTQKIYLRKTLADLVRVDRSGDVPVFQVIDIKATRHATHFHKTQVAFYVRVLEVVLKKYNVIAKLHQDGEIWCIPKHGASDGNEWEKVPFGLAPYLRLVDEFCNKDLPRIAATRVEPSRDDSSFHIYFKCEQCEYLPHCKGSISSDLPPEARDVSAVPGLTHEAKKGLQRFKVRTVGDLSDARGIQNFQNVSWSLKRRAELLVGRARALVTDQVSLLPEAYSYLMPPRVDVCLYLLADHDPIDDSLATLGYLCDYGDEDQSPKSIIKVIETADATEEEDALIEIFSNVIADLKDIDDHNANPETLPGKKIHAHIFLYEPSEGLNIQSAIARHMNNRFVREALLNMVRLFPPDEVVPEPEFQGVHHLPATALRSVFEQLYALPVQVSYDLRKVSGVFARERGVADNYSPREDFKRDFSALLSLEKVREIRDGRSRLSAMHLRKKVKEIENDVHDRLFATRALVKFLIDENQQRVASGGSALLRLNKKPFRFQSTFNPLKAADLDILQAYELLESRAGLLGALIALALPSRDRRDRGKCMANLRLVRTWKHSQSHHRFLFEVPPESRDSELWGERFGLILTDDNPDIRLNYSQWPEVACEIVDKSERHNTNTIEISMRRKNYEAPIIQNLLRTTDERGWHIDRSFVDINSEHAAGFLKYLSE